MSVAILSITYNVVSADRFAKAFEGIEIMPLADSILKGEAVILSITYNVLSADRLAKASDGIDVIWLLSSRLSGKGNVPIHHKQCIKSRQICEGVRGD